MPDLSLEARARGPAAGIDEAGRGPWAGPVVAAAVVLDPAAIPEGIDDSKKLSPARRRALFEALGLSARIGLGAASVAEIDRLNILGATMLAMARALARLGLVPALALVDGNRAPELPCPALTVVGGDSRSLSIAAASIVAKVTRDRLMARLAAAHPGFGWERNAGYGTPEHRAALDRLGITPHHRTSFAPIRKILNPQSY
ncbi:MAG: ribonuclease HII [Alphaproteobacteria bacterium]